MTFLSFSCLFFYLSFPFLRLALLFPLYLLSRPLLPSLPSFLPFTLSLSFLPSLPHFLTHSPSPSLSTSFPRFLILPLFLLLSLSPLFPLLSFLSPTLPLDASIYKKIYMPSSDPFEIIQFCVWHIFIQRIVYTLLGWSVLHTLRYIS